MGKIILFLLIFGFFSTVQGQELRPGFTCVFDRTLIFGASISANTMHNYGLDFGFQLFGKGNFGLGPATVLTRDYAKRSVVWNMTASFGDPTGSEQIEKILGHRKTHLASSMIGVDAFYWDAVWDMCDEGLPQKMIPQLIEFAKDNGIVLVLGKVPVEDPNKILWEKTPDYIRERAWHPPKPQCVAKINQLLVQQCLVGNQCYILDLYQIVQTLNRGGTLKLENGSALNLEKMRPDGVHVSNEGSRYLQEQILSAFAKNRPACVK